MRASECLLEVSGVLLQEWAALLASYQDSALRVPGYAKLSICCLNRLFVLPRPTLLQGHAEDQAGKSAPYLLL